MPYAVVEALRRLGTNLRVARLRRNLTIEDLASRVGVSRYVISDAERGKPTTSLAVYAGMLWALDLLPHLAEVAAPDNDTEGNALSLGGLRKRARASSMKGLLEDL